MKILIKAILQTVARVGLAILVMAILGLYGHSLYYHSRTIEPVSVEKKDLIEVDGPIRDLGEQARELIKQVRSGKDTIYIRINSPGGSLTAGNQLIKAMLAAKTQGVEIVCVVDGIAASMATIILSRCDERLALFGSVIMWHSVTYRGMMQLNQDGAEQLIANLAMLNETHWHHTRKWFYPWYFSKHFKEETLLMASEVEANSLGFLRVIKKMTVVAPEKEEPKKSNEQAVKIELKKHNPKLAPMQLIK